MKPKFIAIAGCFFVLFTTAIAAQYSEDSWVERDKWMKVDELIRWANVIKDGTVADIGCHEGYLSMHLAKSVGENGLVYAVDVREDRLQKLKEHAKSRKHGNIVPVLGDYDDPKLPENKMDAVFVIDAYHEIDEYESMLGHIHKALKPGGRILILEKLKDHARNKSRKEQASAHTLAPGFVKKELKEAGFIITEEYRDIGDWENEKDKKIWVLIARVPEV